MKRNDWFRRVLALVLALVMVIGVSPMAAAAPAGGERKLTLEQVDGVNASVLMETSGYEKPEDPNDHADTDVVRVSIVLEDAPALKKFRTEAIGTNLAAQAYRRELKARQTALTSAIERQALAGEELDVVWNLTLAANLISANVAFGSIEAIAQVKGVKQVVIEERYDPMTALDAAQPYQSIASGMVGAGTAWSAGYTGAGSRIAVIDTGLDTDHQSFDNGAFLYALEELAQRKGMEADAYIESLDLLDKAEINVVLQDLNIYPFIEYLSGTAQGAYYINEKIPFALNYVDRNYQVTHDHDAQGEHGSHVTGIAAANRYIPNAEGGYDNALDAVYTQGIAPDAQVIVMKVFGQGGGAFESDYMVAIEDALWLGCDAVNLSLGANKGFTRSQLYQDILDSLEQSGTVVAIAGGNSGSWADYSANGVGHLYADDVDISVIGSPSTVTNSLAVASVDNTGVTDYYFSVGDSILYYQPGVLNSAYLPGLEILGAGEYTYVVTDGLGTADDVAAAAAKVSDPARAIFVCARGEINFAEKAGNAAAAGFAACIVYNNVDGSFNMNMEGYEGSAPCVSITMADAEILKKAAENGVGTMFVSDTVLPREGDGDVTMSVFSSWGVPGSLQLKPEITAPGGEIYSVDGSVSSGDAYKNLSGTSMASPQVAGMAAVVMQYIRENGLVEKTGLTARQLTTALLMATAEPVIDAATGNPYPVLQQGAGLANVSNALEADAYIRMDEGSTSGAADGKVKVELGDDPQREGSYNFGFTIHNFSDTAQTYSLSSEFFTQGLFEQDGVMYMDKQTVELPVSVSYTVGAEELAVSAAYACDLNGDGLTNEADALLILEYAAKKLDAIDEIADLNADGLVNSYDAHLLLASIESDFFQVKPGEDVHVQVSVSLADTASLDENYVNGAYIEGFVTVQNAPSAEGEVDPDHSIPVLGFYGNWSDASMYDRANYEDYTYGDFIYPYTGGLNYLSVFYDEINEYFYVGNPYLVEDTYPAGREALNSKTELGDMAVTLIRDAGGFLFYVLDGEGNIVDARGAEQLQAAYYYEAYSTWVNITNVGLSIWETPKQMGFQDGDRFTIGFMAVPEYYEENGALTTEELTALMTSGKIGPGAFHEYSFTVDDVAPEVLSVTKDELTGDLTVTAKDGNHIAALAILDAKATNVMTMLVPEQTEAGETTETVIDMSEIADLINRDCMVMAADYAGNETYYLVKDYNEGWSSFEGRMYGFTDTAARGTVNSWMEIIPEDLYYATNEIGEPITSGTVDVANMPFTVTAAEYVGGHVFMIADDGRMYVAEQGDWENCTVVGKQRVYASVRDLAYNTLDGKLYALVSGNAIYSVDLTTGAMTKEYTISLSFPRTVADANMSLLTLAIDDAGNFYAVNNGDTNYKRVYLFKWSAEDVVSGKITDLAPVNNTADGYAGDYVYNDDVNYMGVACMQSMAWDHDADVLYWAAALSNTSPSNILYAFNTETGKAVVATPPISGVADYELGVLSGNVSGLYIVPAETAELPTEDTATGIEISRSELNLLPGAEFRLSCNVYPWNLADSGLTWTSSNERVVTVDSSGLLTAVGVGDAVITATTNSAPNLSAACQVTVSEVQSIDLKALAYNAEGIPQWIDFELTDPAGYTIQQGGDDAGREFIAGTNLGDMLYLHDGTNMYRVDANTFEVTDCGYVDITWQWSDAAPAPRNSEGNFNKIVGIINGGLVFGVMDINTGMGYDLPHMSTFKKDPMAVIAYKGETTFTDEYGTYPAYEYYVLTESGELWVMTTFAFQDADMGSAMYDDAIEHIGSTGIRLTGISDVTSGCYGSMFYDEESDQLIVSASLGSGNQMYVFDPDVCAPVKIDSFFGEGVWPVTALYTYDNFDGLTVKVTPEEAELYQGDSLQLKAKVYQYASDDSVIWSSSDETIATVDENGLVTAHAPGQVTITATSVEGDASAEARLTVLGLYGIDEWFHGYRTTDEGGQWIAINGNDLSTTVLGTSDAVYTGAGVADGKIYATDRTNYFQIDAADGYSVVTGDDFTNGSGAPFMYMLDASAAPVTEVTLPDFATGEEVTVTMGGQVVYLSGYDGDVCHYLTVLDDFETGVFSAAMVDYTYNPAAVAYRSSEIIEGYWFDFYMILGYDGMLETYSLYTAISNGEKVVAGGFESDYVDTGLRFADGDDVSMTWVSSDAFNGVVVSHAGDNGVELWSFDWDTQELNKLGSIEGTDLVGLSLLSEVGLEAPSEPEIPDVPVAEKYLLGYLDMGDSYAWARIDAADGSYETLATDTMAFNGAGAVDGKVYATYAASAWGAKDFYMIDPEADYASTKGYSGYAVYHMYDGAGAPAMDGQDGYLAYISWQYSSYYVFLMNDYASAYGTTQQSVQPSLPAKPLGIAYRSGSVDGTTRTDSFVILCANGALVELTTTASSGVLGKDAATRTLATVSIDGLSSATNVSMTKTGEDVYTISVGTPEGVQLYTYDLTADTLTAGALIDADTLIGLTDYTEITGETPVEPTPDPEPEVPEVDDSLIGYLDMGDSYAWAKIDAADGSYETLATDTMAFNGAGAVDGKVYATYAASAWGAKDFYMIDPEADYASTKGYSGYAVYHMYDGAGAPAMDGQDGYLAYISWQYSSYYVFLMNDYASAYGTTQQSVQPSLPAKPLGIAYRTGAVDGTTRTDSFVILCANGALVELTTTASSGVLGKDAATRTLATVSIDGLSSATNVSMTKTGEDVYTISVGTPEGVQLYTYDLTADTLTAGALIDADTLIGLTLYSEVAPGEETANLSTGSLMSLSLNETTDETADLSWRLDLTETIDVTNGVVEITYDPELLHYEGTNSGNVLLAVNDAEEGKLTVAYAAASAVPAGELIASVLFHATEEYVQTAVTVTVTERNLDTGLSESETTEITLGEKKVLPFVDVPEGSWFYDAVYEIYFDGLMVGMSDTIFAPAGTMNRAMLVTILHRMAGEPETAYTGSFSDVPEGTWFTQSVEWAAANGIVNGYDNGCFGPGDSITREQMVTILYRYAGWIGADTSARADLSSFADADTVSVWAKDAMQWAVAEGLINGMTADHLGPTGLTNRAQVAVLLQRYCEKLS